MGYKVNLVAVVLAVIASVWIWYLPTRTDAVQRETVNGGVEYYQESSEVPQSSRPDIAIWLLLPIALTFAPLVPAGVFTRFLLQAGAAIGLAAIVVATIPSIGLFYLPSAVTMGVAATGSYISGVQ